MLFLVQPVHARADERDGAHNFDWEIGAWRTEVRIRAPLSNEDNWTEFAGTSTVVPLSEGRANCVELDVTHEGRSLRGVSLRLYNPATHQWSLNFANMRDGIFTSPSSGSFSNGRGMFLGRDTVDGREVLVRFIISHYGAHSAHFEQAYSSDGGQTWIVNWIADDTRIS